MIFLKGREERKSVGRKFSFTMFYHATFSTKTILIFLFQDLHMKNTAIIISRICPKFSIIKYATS